MEKIFAVIGLGIFGSNLAAELAAHGAEVLAIDRSREKLETIKSRVTHTVQIDSTDEEALRNQGLEDFDAVIVAIGDDFEASLLTVTLLQQIGIRRIIVRAMTPRHETILQHLGVTEVILPAVEAAERLGNALLYESFLDSFAVSSEYTIVEAAAPEKWIDCTLQELDLRKRFEVSIVTIKRLARKSRVLGMGTKSVESIIGTPQPTTMIQRGDVIIIFGRKEMIDEALRSSLPTG